MLTKDRRISKSILTIDGYQEFNRYRLYAIDTEDYPQSVDLCKKFNGDISVYPLDVYFGIDKLPFKATADVALRIAKLGATAPSYKDAAKQYYETYGVEISDNLVREITDYIGEIVLWNDQKHTEEAAQKYDYGNLRIAKRGRRPKDGFVLYVEADGAMFNTRQRSTKDSDGSDKQSDSDKSTWKENKLGLVFRSDQLIETNEKDDDGNPIKRIGEREYIATTKGIDEFRRRLLYIMDKNGLKDAKDVVFISDGAPWIRKTRELYFPNATQILDLFHLKENAMEFAQYIYHNDKSKYYPWWHKVCKLLEDGHWRDVLALPEVSIYKKQDTPKGTVNLYSYIWNNRDIIDYPTYREKGYFVGSGGIESGNKTVLQQRLKLAGMMWYTDSAETMLALRAKLRSELWESEVVPLVREQYSKHHLFPGNIRKKQREAHKKPVKSGKKENP